MFALTFVNYAALHTTRAMWSAATADIKELYNFTTADVATIDTFFLASYSVGAIFLS